MQGWKAAWAASCAKEKENQDPAVAFVPVRAPRVSLGSAQRRAPLDDITPTRVLDGTPVLGAASGARRSSSRLRDGSVQPPAFSLAVTPSAPACQGRAAHEPAACPVIPEPVVFTSGGQAASTAAGPVRKRLKVRDANQTAPGVQAAEGGKNAGKAAAFPDPAMSFGPKCSAPGPAFISRASSVAGGGGPHNDLPPGRPRVALRTMR